MRRAAKKEHMVTLRAIGCTTAEYMASSGTTDTPNSPADDDADHDEDDEDATTSDDCYVDQSADDYDIEELQSNMHTIDLWITQWIITRKRILEKHKLVK